MAEYKGQFGRVAVDNWGSQVPGTTDREPPMPSWATRRCSVGYERADGWTRRTCVQWERGKCSVPRNIGIVGCGPYGVLLLVPAIAVLMVEGPQASSGYRDVVVARVSPLRLLAAMVRATVRRTMAALSAWGPRALYRRVRWYGAFRLGWWRYHPN